MQQAIQIKTQVDQAIVDAIPALKPWLGHRIQMIALDLESPTTSGDIGRPQDEPEQGAQETKITLEEFLATRPPWPKGRPPLTLEQIREGIIQGAIQSGNV